MTNNEEEAKKIYPYTCHYERRDKNMKENKVITNKERARQICHCNICAPQECCNKTLSDCCDEFKHIMKMAEWKDKQWKNFIKDTYNKLNSEGYNDRVKTGFEIFYDDLM